jgi:hypothetical protein
MKITWRIVSLTILLSSTAWAPALRAQMPSESRVTRLDALVHLTAEQRTKVAAVYEQEAKAMLNGTRAGRGMFDIAQNTIAEVRALLTPEQLKIFDRTSTANGGALMMAPPEDSLSRLDQQVGLTEAQKAVALQVYKEQFDSLAAMSVEEREAKGSRFYLAAQGQIRALLTPDQVDKFDQARAVMSERDPADIAAINNALRESSPLAARVGKVTSIQRMGRSTRTTKDGQSGEDRFKVGGESGSAIVTVFWTRSPSSSPLTITKITAAQEETLTP